MPNDTAVDYDGLIPNNVGLNAGPAAAAGAGELASDLSRLVEGARARTGFRTSLVYLRTAIGVDQEGWAKFGYVRMPEYRWGILLAPQVDGPHDRRSARIRASRPGRRCRANTARCCAG